MSQVMNGLSVFSYIVSFVLNWIHLFHFSLNFGKAYNIIQRFVVLVLTLSLFLTSLHDIFFSGRDHSRGH